MADTPAVARLRGGHYNTSDWNASTNPGGMGGDGHRYAMIPPKAPQTPTYPVMVNDMVAMADEVAASANAAAGSATTASAVLSNAQALLSNATLDGSSNSSTSVSVDTAAKTLTVATNKAFNVNHMIQVTRVSSPTTWLRGTVTAYNAGTGALSFTPTAVNAPGGTGPFTDWTVSIISGTNGAGDAASVTMTGPLTLTNASARVQTLDPNGASRNVLLPAANLMPGAGGPVFIIRNAMVETGALYVLDIRDNAGTFLRSLYPGDVAYVSLLSRANAIGTWDIAVINRDEGGAAVNMAMSGDLVLDRSVYRSKVFHLAPTDANRSVTLPVATSVEFLGGPLWYIRNAATSFPLTVKNGAGTVLARLSPQQTAVISCYNRSSVAGGWAVDVISNDPNGGVGNVSLTADFNMSAWGPRTLRCTPDGLGRIITLPDATTLGASGGPVAHIINHSNTFSLSIRAAAGTSVLATVAPGQAATVHLLDRSTVQGAWYIFVNTPAVANETLVGVTTSGRIALTSPSTSINNHKLSATATAGKVIWSYGRLNNLCVRVLTIVGRNVTVGVENILTTMMGDGCGQAIALSDTYGIATFCSGNDVYSQGFSINLSTNVCTLSGSSNAWGVGFGYSAEIRMDRVPGQNGAIAVVRRPSDAASILRLASYNGSTLSASSTVSGLGIDTLSRHDIVAVSSTEARHYCSSGGRLCGRPITLSVPSLTMSLGSVVDSGTASGDIFAVAADTTWSVTFYQDGSAYGAYARAWTGSLAGPQVTLSAVNQARHGAVVMWNSTSGMFLYSDYAGGSNQLYLQDFTLAGSSPYITVDAAKKRLLNASAGLAQSNGGHLTAALTLSPTSGLLLFNDEGNSNYPTIVVVERSL